MNKSKLRADFIFFKCNWYEWKNRIYVFWIQKFIFNLFLPKTPKKNINTFTNS